MPSENWVLGGSDQASCKRQFFDCSEKKHNQSLEESVSAVQRYLNNTFGCIILVYKSDSQVNRHVRIASDQMNRASQLVIPTFIVICIHDMCDCQMYRSSFFPPRSLYPFFVPILCTRFPSIHTHAAFSRIYTESNKAAARVSANVGTTRKKKKKRITGETLNSIYYYYIQEFSASNPILCLHSKHVAPDKSISLVIISQKRKSPYL